MIVPILLQPSERKCSLHKLCAISVVVDNYDIFYILDSVDMTMMNAFTLFLGSFGLDHQLPAK